MIVRLPVESAMEVTTTSDKIRVHASYPFDDPQADLVLRSVDGTDFRVMKCILALSSPAISRIFSTRSPEPEPVVSMPEPRSILDPLLRILYPIPSPALSDLETIGAILDAAHKYEMADAFAYAREALRARLTGAIGRCNCSVEDPGSESDAESDTDAVSDAVAIFSLACLFRLEAEACLAARAFLAGPLTHAFRPQLAHISGASYYHLLDYHRRVCEAVHALFLTFDYSKTVLRHVQVQDHVCNEMRREDYCLTSGEKSERDTCEWWYQTREEVASKLCKAPLARGVLMSSSASKYFKNIECYQCREKAFEGWDKLRMLTLLRVSELADKVGRSPSIGISKRSRLRSGLGRTCASLEYE